MYTYPHMEKQRERDRLILKNWFMHHQFNGHEFEQTPGDGEGQGDLACCDSWGRKESDTTEPLN